MVVSPRVLKIVLVVAIALSLLKLVFGRRKRVHRGRWSHWKGGAGGVKPYEAFGGEDYEDADADAEDEDAEDEDAEDEDAEDDYEDEDAEDEDYEDDYEDEDYEDEDAEDEDYEDDYEDEDYETSGAATAGSTVDKLGVATDLLPKPTWTDQNFAEFAPKALLGQNFLDTQKYIGVDTKGSSLRNPSYDLRATPTIPRKDIGPWAQSTIDADLYRRPLE